MQGRILVSAGEPSGDAHGGALVAALGAALPGFEIEAVGGPAMARAGAVVRWPMEPLSGIGFVRVIASVPRHARLAREILTRAREGRYQLAILIDYPGFHLRLGARLRALGVPVLYYVMPQLWAWRAERLRALERAADRVAVILPFEQEWLRSRGVTGRFVGHPLLDREVPGQREARRLLGLPEAGRVLGIFPGSRTAEIRRHWELFRRVGERMLAEARADHAVVAGTEEAEYPGARTISIVRGKASAVMAAATAALVKSGTTTLEGALAGVPMVVAYRASWPTYVIARGLMTTRRIALVNLIGAGVVAPEFWRLPLDADELCGALGPLLDSGSGAHQAQQRGLLAVRMAMGEPGAAERVAGMARELLAA